MNVIGKQQYLIRFEVRNAFLWLTDWTEFKWDVIGSEWGVPIKKWNINLQFTDEFNDALGAIILTASPANNRKGGLTFTRNDLNIRASSQKSLSVGEGVTLAVQIAPGFIPHPAKVANKKTLPQLRKDYSSPIVAVFAGLLFYGWRRARRNADIDPVVQHYPPGRLSPAQCGAILNPHMGQRNMISLIPTGED